MSPRDVTNVSLSTESEFEENHCLKEIDAFMQCSRKYGV